MPSEAFLQEASARLRAMKREAVRHPWTGQHAISRRHAWDTSAMLEPGRATRILLTLDIGYHASGWWRNSTYDRCFHLSVSHPIFVTGRGPVGYDLEAVTEAECRAWARLAFGEHVRWAWLEPAAATLDVDVVAGRRAPGVARTAVRRPIQPTDPAQGRGL